MTAYLSGLVWLRADDQDQRLKELDHTALTVLSVMASFAGEPTDDRPPMCFAARSSIARRARMNTTTVMRALLRLEAAGVIDRGGLRGKTVRWQLTAVGRLWCGEHHKAACSAESTTSGTSPDQPRRTTANWRADTTGAESTTRTGAESTTRTGAESTTIHPDSTERKRSRRGSVARAPSRSAGAPRSGLAPSTRALTTQVADQLGVPEDVAEAWIAERVDASTTPVRNIPAFIYTCLERATPAPIKNAAKTKPTPEPVDKPTHLCRTCGNRVDSPYHRNVCAKETTLACAVTGCTNPPRNACRTCFNHMEMEVQIR